MKNIGTLTPTAETMLSCCRALLLDIARTFAGYVYVQQDSEYLRTRCASEGDSVLLTALPTMGRAVELSLITCEPIVVPQGWELCGKTRLPRFLNYLFLQVFKTDGVPLDRESLNCQAAYLLRQLFLLYSKVETAVSPALSLLAIAQFKERTSKEPNVKYHLDLYEARALLGKVFRNGEPFVDDLHRFRNKPWGRHGPGAVASQASPSEKWEFNHWPGLQTSLFQFNERVSVPSKGMPSQPYSRVTCVPKDFRGPRVICIEPKENQFAQQGLMAILYKLCHANTLTRRSISFESTSRSEQLCYDNSYATIDLKDASDYLSMSLVKRLFPRWVFSLLTRYRTRTISSGSDTWRPRSFATMGSALCFPIETMVFWSIAKAVVNKIGAIEKRPNREVRVFGDDIIVPLYSVNYVILALERCGLVINRSKTCVGPLVRESCGEWVLCGNSSRVIRFRSTGVSDERSWLQYCDYLTAVRTRGLLNLESAITMQLENLLPSSDVKRRWNRRLQRFEWLLPTIADRGSRSELAGEPGMYAWHAHNDTAPFLKGARKRVKMRWLENPLLYG